MNKNNQQGFAHVLAVLLVVVVIAAFAYVGIKIANNQDATENGNQTTTEQQENVPQIDDSNDLEDAESFLNETDIDSELDTSEIDAALNE